MTLAPKPKIMEWVGRELKDQPPTPLPWTGTMSRLLQALSNLKCLPLPPALGTDVSRAGGKPKVGKSPAGTAASPGRLHHKSAQGELAPSIRCPGFRRNKQKASSSKPPDCLCSKCPTQKEPWLWDHSITRVGKALQDQ